MAKSALKADGLEQEPSAEDLIERGRARKAKPGLTPEEIADLEATYRDVATSDDDDAKALRRMIIAKLRRATHTEIHPACRKVEVDVPLHPMGSMFTINGKPYVGRVTLWACEARQLAAMVQEARTVERNRLREGGRTIDLDNPVAERLRAIQEA